MSLTINCPSCNAVLRNISAQPGASAHCLNCSKRFIPQIEGAITLDGGAISQPAPLREQDADAVLIREPGSAGYWLLRVPAVIIFVASVFCFLIFGYKILGFVGRPGIGQREVWLLSYLPLWPWAGVFLLLLTRSLARIDAGMVKLAWRSGMLKQPLSGISGSSLPYIAPLAVGGGYLPIFMVQCGFPQDQVFQGSIIGALLFYLGFAMEDVRQFISRQDAMARICSGFADESMMKKGIPLGGDVAPACGGGRQECLPHQQEILPSQQKILFHQLMSQHGLKNDAKQSSLCSPTKFFFPTGLLLTGTIVSFVALWIIDNFVQPPSYYYYGQRYHDNMKTVYFCIVLMGAAYSLYLLGRNWDQAMSRWRGALAASMSADSNLFIHTAASLNGKRLSVYLKWFCNVPVIWAVLGLLWVVIFVGMKEGKTGRDFLMLFCYSTGGTACALWLAYFLKQVSQWRTAQQCIWVMRQRSVESGSNTDHSLDSAKISTDVRACHIALPWLHRIVVWGVVVLVSIELMLLCYVVNNQFTRNRFNPSELLGFPLLAMIFHYPTLWLAMLLGEMLLMEAFYKKSVSEEFDK